MYLFSTDIDGTIYDGPDSADLFADFWSRNSEAVLVYNTGRSVDDTRNLIGSTALPLPDFITGGVGTEIFDCRSGENLHDWSNKLSADWDFEKVDHLVKTHCEDLERQPVECQNEFKCSWYWRGRSREDIDVLGEKLREEGISAQVVYSSSRDLDVIPARANKGNAVSWLAERLGVSISNVIVAGDSGNDSSMFQLEGARGIIPANAEWSLKIATRKTYTFESSGACAAGIIEGFHHFTITYQS